MRTAIGDMESALYGCDALLDLRDTWEGENVRADLLLSPRLPWGELARIFAALDDLNKIVNDPEFSFHQFQQSGDRTSVSGGTTDA